jgi:hypothetical protein
MDNDWTETMDNLLNCKMEETRLQLQLQLSVISVRDQV